MAKRPNILKLATKISLESMTYTGITYNDPEYKILEPIIDDEMCAIMMHLRLEANRTVEDVAKRAKQSVEYTQTQLDKLAKTGAVRYRYVDGKRCYFYPIWVPGIMEMVPAIGQRNFAPPYSRMSRTLSFQPLGSPFLVGSSDRDRWVLTIIVQ